MGLRISDFQPAGAGQEPDAFAAGAGDLDDAVAHFDDAAIHDADDIDQASGAAREQRAAIGDGAAHDRGAAARGLNDRASTERAAAQRQGAGADDFEERAGKERPALDRVGRAAHRLDQGAGAGGREFPRAGDRGAVERERRGARRPADGDGAGIGNGTLERQRGAVGDFEDRAGHGRAAAEHVAGAAADGLDHGVAADRLQLAARDRDTIEIDMGADARCQHQAGAGVGDRDSVEQHFGVCARCRDRLRIGHVALDGEPGTRRPLQRAGIDHPVGAGADGQRGASVAVDVAAVDQREVGIADRAGAGDGVAGIGQCCRAAVSDDGVLKTVRQDHLAAARQGERSVDLEPRRVGRPLSVMEPLLRKLPPSTSVALSATTMAPELTPVPVPSAAVKVPAVMSSAAPCEVTIAPMVGLSAAVLLTDAAGADHRLGARTGNAAGPVAGRRPNAGSARLPIVRSEVDDILDDCGIGAENRRRSAKRFRS